MEREKALSITRDIMSDLTQTEEYICAMKEDLQIHHAVMKLELIYAKLGIDDEVYEELDTAVYALINAHSDAAILYGMQVADALRYTSYHPQEYGALLMAERAEKDTPPVS